MAGKPRGRRADWITGTMDYDEWVRKYLPVRQNDTAAVDGCMLDHGVAEDYAKMLAAPPRCLWTVIAPDSCRHWVISSGFHIVNRLGYIVTKIPFSGDYMAVKY
jgi:hypothetical protein